MTTEEFQRHIAQLLHETADLVAQGLVVCQSVHAQYDTREFMSLERGRQRYNTGIQRVTVEFVGFSGTVVPMANMPQERAMLPPGRAGLLEKQP